MRKMFIAAAAGAFATSLVGSIALAQTTPEVTVSATRLVETRAGTTASGIPIVNITLAYGVSYSGLDLSSHAGAMQLEKRVSDAAMAACKEIARQYPDSQPKDAECAKAATDKAMVRVRELEAAADKKAGK